MKDMQELTEKEFFEKYKPIDSPQQSLTWTWQEVKDANIPLGRVWTVLETGDPDDENWYVTPGYHVVNKIDYAVTEIPWEHENIEGVFHEDNRDPDDEADYDCALRNFAKFLEIPCPTPGCDKPEGELCDTPSVWVHLERIQVTVQQDDLELKYADVMTDYKFEIQVIHRQEEGKVGK